MLNVFYTMKIGANGYKWVYLPNHLDYLECSAIAGRLGKDGTWVYLHRYVVCLCLERELRRGERIIFEDGDKSNCSISNLRLATTVPIIENKDLIANLYREMSGRTTATTQK